MGEHGQLHTRHLLNREKAEENSFHASWLLKKPHLRRLRHMYVINSKCTLISLKEPYKVFQFQLKLSILEGSCVCERGETYVSLFMWEIKMQTQSGVILSAKYESYFEFLLWLNAEYIFQ